jgi:urease accessory protein
MQPQLAVSFARDASGRTFVAQQRATHPFHLCRPLYRPEDPPGLPTLYVQGCSGGLFEGDRWTLDIRARAGASAHVTTAAATLVHRMPHGGCAEHEQHLWAEPGALLEYFPDPLILFSRSRLRSTTVIHLAPGARVVAIDSFLPHRLPDDAAPFEWFESVLSIEDAGGELLARDRFRATGAEVERRVAGVTGAFRHQATLLVLGAGAGPLEALRGAIENGERLRAGASLLPEEAGVMARILASDGPALRTALQRGWTAARVALGVAPGLTRPK